MNKNFKKNLGFPKVDDPTPPGTRSGDIGRVIYVLLKGYTDSYDAFDEVISRARSTPSTHGAALVEDWLVKTPTGEIFFPIFFHGDEEGWRQRIELGASQLGWKMAKMGDHKFAVTDGPVFPLADCAITAGGSPFPLPNR
jgi:hypothetical protein